MEETKKKKPSISVSVSEAQKEVFTAKAKAYGISRSELVIRAVEAYERTDGNLGDEQIVAVSYGALNEVTHYFGTVRNLLKTIAAESLQANHHFTSARYEEALVVSKEILGHIGEAVEELKTISDAVKTISERSLIKVFELPFESDGWTIVTQSEW